MPVIEGYYVNIFCLARCPFPGPWLEKADFCCLSGFVVWGSFVVIVAFGGCFCFAFVQAPWFLVSGFFQNCLFVSLPGLDMIFLDGVLSILVAR